MGNSAKNSQGNSKLMGDSDGRKNMSSARD